VSSTDAVLDYSSDVGNGWQRYQLAGTVLIVESRGKTATVRLDDVRSVQLAELNNHSFCTLKTADGKETVVTSGFIEQGKGGGKARHFRELLVELHARIASSAKGAHFVSGSWFLVGIYAALTMLGLVASVLITLFGVPDTIGSGLQGKAFLVQLMGPVLVVLFPFTYFAVRPKQYPPQKLPERFLPRD
jgi:hypothetical protein